METTRRDLVAAGSLLLLKPQTAFTYQANSNVELGLIGCGSRGNWITDLFIEYTGARFVAAADAFAEPLEKAGAKYKIDSARRYSGLDAYQALINSKLDGVVIETPPYFHPAQAAAAVAAGKHVYLAKPVATDVAGCKVITAAAEKARGTVSFLVDFQSRARPVFQDAAARVKAGQLGQLVFAQVYYHAKPNQYHKTDGMTPEQARLRNWLHDRKYSGDIIVEQNVHVLDMGNWFLDARPLRAWGTGGQKSRKLGDVWDHYIVTYWYPDDVKVDFSSVQFADGYGDLCARVYGSRGTLDAHYGGMVRITGKEPWDGAEKDPTFREGAVTNLKDFVDSIKTGKLLNNGVVSVTSTLTGVLGRMAAESPRPVTWDEMVSSA